MNWSRTDRISVGEGGTRMVEAVSLHGGYGGLFG